MSAQLLGVAALLVAVAHRSFTHHLSTHTDMCVCVRVCVCVCAHVCVCVLQEIRTGGVIYHHTLLTTLL